MSTLLQFEELAFRASLEACPHDQTAARAYVDWLMEFGGMTPIRARRAVVAIRREYAEALEVSQMTSKLNTHFDFSVRVRKLCRRMFRIPRGANFDIRVVRTSVTAYCSHVPECARLIHTGRVLSVEEAQRQSGEWDRVPDEIVAHVPAARLKRWFQEFTESRHGK